MMQVMFCLVTVAVSLLYGTRIAWDCGRKCQVNKGPSTRKDLLFGSFPAAILVYLFGFEVVFTYLLDGFVTVNVFSFTSAILLSSLVVSMSMPELKRPPRQ